MSGSARCWRRCSTMLFLFFSRLRSSKCKQIPCCCHEQVCHGLSGQHETACGKFGASARTWHKFSEPPNWPSQVRLLLAGCNSLLRYLPASQRYSQVAFLPVTVALWRRVCSGKEVAIATMLTWIIKMAMVLESQLFWVFIVLTSSMKEGRKEGSNCLAM